jgi:hypothetical protein
MRICGADEIETRNEKGEDFLVYNSTVYMILNPDSVQHGSRERLGVGVVYGKRFRGSPNEFAGVFFVEGKKSSSRIRITLFFSSVSPHERERD